MQLQKKKHDTVSLVEQCSEDDADEGSQRRVWVMQRDREEQQRNAGQIKSEQICCVQHDAGLGVLNLNTVVLRPRQGGWK